MSTKNEVKNNMITNGPIGLSIFRFFMPLVIGTIVQQVYTMVDAVILGRFVGKLALATVGGSVGMITYFVVFFFTTIFAGAAVLSAQRCGAGDEKGLDVSLHTMMGLAVICAVVMTFVGELSVTWSLNLLDTPKELMQYSKEYLYVYYAGFAGPIFYNAGSAALRAVGDSRRPIIYLAFSCILNIVLDILFVIVIPMEVMGAAIATVISQLLSALLVIIAVRKPYEIDGVTMKLSFCRIKKLFSMRVLKSQLSIGIPAAAESVVYCVTNIMVQIVINHFDTNAIAAWATYFKVDTILWSVSAAFATTVTTFCGQNYGARQIKRTFGCARASMLQGCTVYAIVIVICYIFAAPIMGLFVTDAEVINLGVYIIRNFMPWYMLSIIMEIIMGALRGLGDVKIPTAISVGFLLIQRIPWLIWIMPIYMTHSCLIQSYYVTWILALAILIPYYFFRKHKTKKKFENIA
ncbi:MAG: MATE family efflux transporter [Firmicutes bacterium]|nr:MATE family efflux transporter [Bacillota bacterium]